MDKNDRSMLKQVMGALSHMGSIDAEAKKAIMSELERIEKKEAPKKKEDVVEKPVENLEKK